MKKIILLNKSVGLSPLDSIRWFQVKNPEYSHAKIAYAGRLDPMAEGLLLLLIGEECKNRKQYERLPKEYRFTALFGLESDTYDILGIVREGGKKQVPNQSITALLPRYSGTVSQEYPPYSSARVNGKPLFYWARKNNLDSITIPSKEITISSLTLESTSTITHTQLIPLVIKKIASVSGDFRQEEIVNSWKNLSSIKEAYTLATFSIQCSSGTYIRSLVHDMGKQLSTGALTFFLERTKIGDYSKVDAIKINS